jgi:hypothetical protein
MPETYVHDLPHAAGGPVKNTGGSSSRHQAVTR